MQCNIPTIIIFVEPFIVLDNYLDTNWGLLKDGASWGCFSLCEGSFLSHTKAWAEFFDNEGLVPFIHLDESNWVSWFPKDQVVTLYLFHRPVNFKNNFKSKTKIYFNFSFSKKIKQIISKNKRKTAIFSKGQWNPRVHKYHESPWSLSAYCHYHG